MSARVYLLGVVGDVPLTEGLARLRAEVERLRRRLHRTGQLAANGDKGGSHDRG